MNVDRYEKIVVGVTFIALVVGIVACLLFFGCQHIPYTDIIKYEDVEQPECDYILFDGFDQTCVIHIVEEVEVVREVEVTVERIVEIIVTEVVTEIVEVPVEIIVEKVVEKLVYIENIRYVEVPIEVFVTETIEVIKEVIKEVEVPVEVIKEVPVVIKEVPVEIIVEKLDEVDNDIQEVDPLEVIKEVPVVIKEVPVEIIVEKLVEVDNDIQEGDPPEAKNETQEVDSTVVVDPPAVDNTPNVARVTTNGYTTRIEIGSSHFSYNYQGNTITTGKHGNNGTPVVYEVRNGNLETASLGNMGDGRQGVLVVWVKPLTQPNGSHMQEDDPDTLANESKCVSHEKASALAPQIWTTETVWVEIAPNAFSYGGEKETNLMTGEGVHTNPDGTKEMFTVASSATLDWYRNVNGAKVSCKTE